MGLKEKLNSATSAYRNAWDSLRFQRPQSVGIATISEKHGLIDDGLGEQLQVLSLAYSGVKKEAMGCTLTVPKDCFELDQRVEVVIQLPRKLGIGVDTTDNFSYRRAIRSLNQSSERGGKPITLDDATQHMLEGNKTNVLASLDFAQTFLGVEVERT